MALDHDFRAKFDIRRSTPESETGDQVRVSLIGHKLNLCPMGSEIDTQRVAPVSEFAVR